jgi:hypothetical protein
MAIVASLIYLSINILANNALVFEELLVKLLILKDGAPWLWHSSPNLTPLQVERECMEIAEGEKRVSVKLWLQNFGRINSG